MLLKLLPALKHTCNFSWQQGTILLEHNDKNNDTMKEEPDMKLILTDKEWQQLHRYAYSVMTEWANKEKSNHFAMAWRTAVREGLLTAESTWEQTKP